MKSVKLIFGTLLLTLGIWACVAWPLPRHMLSGIPSSARNTEQPQVRAMIAGDHLQFLYHFWLAKDTFFGPTPLFHNLYEFNTGRDEDRREFSTYYLPFSLIFAVTSVAGNQALGWNMTGLLALWITVFFTYLLARRYSRDPLTAGLAAGLAILIPYRWFTLFGGSPTGLAMAWVPIIFFGLDVMIRDRKRWGAVLAGASIYFSGWTDPHVLFFTTLAAPCWCVISYVFRREKLLPSWKDIREYLACTWPFVLFMGLVLLQAMGVKDNLADTEIASAARPEFVVSIFSPRFQGAFAWNAEGHDGQIYLGYALTFLLLAAFAAQIRQWTRARQTDRTSGRTLFAGLCLLLGLACILLLATGPNNPFGPRLWRLMIRIIPPYGKIRQAAKIFVLLPTIAAVLLAITWPALLDLLKTRRRRTLATGLAGLVLLLDFSMQTHPTICTLDRAQGAYKAVAEDAAAYGDTARLLALPLWPGDSHWTSLNQYYVSLYRLRMVNGYRPTARKGYLTDIFDRFQSFNSGGYSEEQLENLLQRGIRYVVLHEDAFPEKVSPFAVAHTLHSLLAHPRIKFLRQDGPVWAFKIVDAPNGIEPDLPDWHARMPARLWQAERAEAQNVILKEAEDTSGGRYVQLPYAGATLSTQPYPLHHIQNLCFLVRVRGSGPCETILTIGDKDHLGPPLSTTDDNQWTWRRIEIPPFEGYAPIQLSLRQDGSPMDVDLILLMAEKWNPGTTVGPWIFAAPEFFHAGYTDRKTGEVVLRPEREPADAIFYGPRYPFPAGVYDIQVEYRTDAKPGTCLGELKPRFPSPRTKPEPIIAGEPARLTYFLDNNLRLAFDLVYNRAATLRIKTVRIVKLPDAP